MSKKMSQAAMQMMGGKGNRAKPAPSKMANSKRSAGKAGGGKKAC
jgi:hypothetical protein